MIFYFCLSKFKLQGVLIVLTSNYMGSTNPWAFNCFEKQRLECKLLTYFPIHCDLYESLCITLSKKNTFQHQCAKTLLRFVHLISSLFKIRQPLLEWYMARLALENRHQNEIFNDEHQDWTMCSKYIKHYSRFKNEYNWESLYEHSKNKTLNSYNFCISTLI